MQVRDLSSLKVTKLMSQIIRVHQLISTGTGTADIRVEHVIYVEQFGQNLE